MAGLSCSIRSIDLRSTRTSSDGHGSDEYPNTRYGSWYSHLDLDRCTWGWSNVVPISNLSNILGAGMVNAEWDQRGDWHRCPCAKYAIVSLILSLFGPQVANCPFQ